ncbi:transcription regulator with diacylglycerol kinase catalytic domain [Piscinibacter sakaiensis]|uniref:Transcription regulator with diacylglycerol kinase catalytic domain n=2 Tax=Piscinibacter sakaiensis TaxID=1547922 RepID=A0A0K8NT65_PISS1|nr:transcription regulator with diacylglycerol kinase catalytic domain [Piscinibacter sakaiensis]
MTAPGAAEGPAATPGTDAGAAPPAVDGPLIVVMNAASGARDAASVRDRIAQRLTQAGRTHEIELVTKRGTIGRVAADAVRRAVARRGVVVAVGGDGTLNAVAQAALAAGCAFGVLPQGTFNYFGRTHAISQEVDEALDVLLAGRPQPVQVGRIADAHRERVFLVNASLGLYPQLLEDRETYKARFGRRRWVALWSALVTLMREHRQLALRIAWCAGPGEASAPAGAERLLRTPTLFVGNNRLQLEQLGIAQAEALAQGRLVALALKPVGTRAMLGLLLRGALGRLGEAEEVLAVALTGMTVRHAARYGPRRVKVATDGEVAWMQAPLHFGVAPKPLWLIKAAPDAEGARG